jgi:hypothetical protein
MNNQGYLIIGGGGHALALAEILVKQNKLLLGVVAPNILAKNTIFNGVPHYLKDDDVLTFSVQCLIKH